MVISQGSPGCKIHDWPTQTAFAGSPGHEEQLLNDRLIHLWFGKLRERWKAIPSSFLLAVRRARSSSHRSVIDAYQPMFFQFASGALHVDILIGRQFCTDLVVRSRTRLDVFGELGLRDFLQILADSATRGYRFNSLANPRTAECASVGHC